MISVKRVGEDDISDEQSLRLGKWQDTLRQGKVKGSQAFVLEHDSCRSSESKIRMKAAL